MVGGWGHASHAEDFSRIMVGSAPGIYCILLKMVAVGYGTQSTYDWRMVVGYCRC